MQDVFAYCAELVRAADRDRYLAALFAPAERRDSLFALYAFNVEIGRVREAAREALPGEIRLKWWSEVLDGARREEAAANPVAAALLSAIERYGLAAGTLLDLIEAHRFDLYDEPMATMADCEAYATRTSSAVMSSCGADSWCRGGRDCRTCRNSLLHHRPPARIAAVRRTASALRADRAS